MLIFEKISVWRRARCVADTSHTLRKFIKMHVYQETVGKIAKNENTYFLLRQGTKCKIIK